MEFLDMRGNFSGLHQIAVAGFDSRSFLLEEEWERESREQPVNQLIENQIQVWLFEGVRTSNYCQAEF